MDEFHEPHASRTHSVYSMIMTFQYLPLFKDNVLRRWIQCDLDDHGDSWI